MKVRIITSASSAIHDLHNQSIKNLVHRLNKPILITLLLTGLASGQKHILSGTVIDAESNHPLSSATVRIAGGSKGTISNAEGHFRIALPAGSYQLAVSYLGYQSDTVRIELTRDLHQHVALQPNAIQLAGVTVTDEDPAYEIIRRAIESKKRWMAQLGTFQAKAFNRTQINSDSSIAAITEAYSTLYWRKEDSLREVITQQKKTGNLPASMQMARVGEIVNFNDDRIKQNGYTFVGPIAPNALDVYEYRLLSTRTMDAYDIYDIELIPRSSIIPLFKGTITIAERSYAVMNVDVTPNEAFTQMFINTANARYIQSFRLFEEKFWLPVHYRFEGTYSISIVGFTFPAFGIERDVVIYDYVLNPAFADTIALLKKMTIDSSAQQFDSLFWASNDLLPLDQEQLTAYQVLDSTQSLDKKFAPTGASAAVLNMTDGLLGYPDVWFNRVEGLHLGISKSFSSVFDDIDLRGGIGYGLSDKAWKWGAGGTIHFGPQSTSSGSSGIATIGVIKRMFALKIDLYDTYIYFPEPMLPGLFLNSFASLLLKDDVQDYYRSIGATIALNYAQSGSTGFSLSLMSERQHSLVQWTNYSFVAKNKAYAFQPGIIDGRMNSFTLSVLHGSPGMFGLSKSGYVLTASAEQAVSLFNGIFDFTVMKGKARGKIATMFEEESVFPPTLGFQIAVGTSLGNVPPQRYFELYAKFETLAGYGTLKALPRRQFYGDSYIAFTLDHNFRRILFAPLGIRSLMESGLELIIEANAARSWLSRDALRTPLFPARDSGGWYYEASIGISNIADVLRFDITRRLSSPGDWAFSLTISDFIAGLMIQ